MNFLEQHKTVFGRILTFELPMEAYPDRRPRTIRVWLPDSYDGSRRFPVLYMHDGQNLFTESESRCNSWHVNQEMNLLCKEQLPAIVVGIDNADTRMSELCPDMPVNPDMYEICSLPHKQIVPTGHLYAKFVAEQLKPVIAVSYTHLTLPTIWQV